MTLHTRRVKRARLLMIMIVLTAVVVGYSQPHLWAQTPLQEAEQVRHLLAELGTDDGFACVLFYGSDIDGNLETCG